MPDSLAGISVRIFVYVDACLAQEVAAGLAEGNEDRLMQAFSFFIRAAV